MAKYGTNVLHADLLLACGCELGEGIQWNAAKGRLYWTDIFRNALWSCDADGGDPLRLDLSAGLCAFAFADNGLILAAFTDGLYWLDEEAGVRNQIRSYDADRSQTRMNDGALDRQGRFIVGGMDEEAMAPVTQVWSVSPLGIETLFDGVGCANSIAFSPDGRTMFFADSTGTDIYRYDYDLVTGQTSNRTIFATGVVGLGVPDGSTVDSQGALWNARFGGQCVQRFLPDGSPDLRVLLPVANATCCCFGGTDMRRLFVSTARAGMTETELDAMPEAGGIYAIDVPVCGLTHGTYKT